FRHTVRWKNVSLSLNIAYKLGYYFRRSSIDYNNLVTNWGGHSDYNQRWQKPGDETRTNVPSMADLMNRLRDQVYLYSDILALRADHIRLRDLRLSYDINRRAGKTALAEHLQLYLYVNNVCMLWKANHYGIDPDYGSWLMPTPRTVSAGMVIDF
ncbi:MAG: SusC/RagA family TonB-linked outer membrane protein, partial [Bacteroidetes bacterium]|nr:SusC/RagA family TonB-linked outer membrane protein [Bacteroidota bacterium]